MSASAATRATLPVAGARPLLDVDDVTLHFHGIVALDGLSFSVGEGEICGLIGPNGAGKTSVFNVVSRIYDPSRGRVTFRGQDLLSQPRHRMARLGITRTFQNLALFPTMTLLENVMVGGHSRGRTGFARAVLRAGTRREDRAMRERAAALLDRIGLADSMHRPAAGLPFGTLKRLELARALAAEPALLLLDEPAAGLTHGEVDELGDTILRLRSDLDVTVLLVEHHMSMVMRISDQVVAMDFGRRIACGTPKEIQQDAAVIEAYLGTEQ